MAMCVPSLVLFLALLPLTSSSNPKIHTSLNSGYSLFPLGDLLISSPAAIFTAGFYQVGDNAYCFAIWFTDVNHTPVWMANRDDPVNGRYTKLSLLQSGNLVLKDAGQLLVWESNTESASVLKLYDNGNLVLSNKYNVTVWQSFDHPTNTLLPQQPLTGNTKLVSSRSLANHSSGFYELYFDNDNVLRLLHNGPEVRSVFWPSPWLKSWDAGRSTYNTTKIAVLDLYGNFVSSDKFRFQTSDLGNGPQRRMSLDPDGLVRVYSLNKHRWEWEVTWQLDVPPCNIHGICGANSMCTFSPRSGRRTCSCLPGYRFKNASDWSEGCVPKFKKVPCNNNQSTDSESFLHISHSEFYGYDIGYFQNYTLEKCGSLCRSYCDCKGFQYKFERENGYYSCFPKTLLFNGYQSSGFNDGIYVRLPKHMSESKEIMSDQEPVLQCTSRTMEIRRAYQKGDQHTWWKPLAWCAGALGAIEAIGLLVFLCASSNRGKQVIYTEYVKYVNIF